MLEYSKMILSKVSFDKSLFEKELAKAIKLVGKELEALKKWCYQNFNDMYQSILNKHFKQLTQSST